MAKVIEQVRIFISSPSDVNKEREAALKVINELNQTHCDSLGIMLFPLTWEDNTYPSVGDYSQDVINNQIGEYDIFVGIMANRFGTPTPKAGSGTEEEFKIAYDNRENTQIMFFFKDTAIRPSSLDLEQYQKVIEFKKNLPKGVYYREFSEDFEGLFRKSLTQHLNDKYSKKNEKQITDAEETHKKNKINQINSFFVNYHRRMQEELSSISVLAVPNSQFNLKDIYVSQSLEKKELYESKSEVIKINSFPEELIKTYKKILIRDTVGKGKSTIMKFMFLDLIDNKIKDVGIPIFIELNRLNKNFTILNEINEELNLTKDFEKDLLLSYIQKGGFIFFLDGYDEISIADKIEVTKDIQTFISKTGTENYYIMASRPEERLAFRGFQSFTIQPLTKNEAFELLAKYDTSKQKKISNELIKELNSGKYESIDEYLENPLLASLLYTSFNYKAEIPLKKHQFYRQIYDALYSNHKLVHSQKAHEKRSNLDIDDFDRVLRYIGYECLFSIGVQFDKDTILNSIKSAKDFCGNLIFKEHDFLKDLLTSVPLFAKDGTGYKWVHKSLMEYFAARFIYCDAKENQDGILSEIYNSNDISKYINMLDLYYDIDPKGFSKNITLPYCEGYLRLYHSSTVPSKISEDLVNRRISSLVWGKYAFALTSNKEKDYKKQLFKQIEFANSIIRRRGGVDYGIRLFFVYDISKKHLFSLFKRKIPKLFLRSDFTYKKAEWISIITDNFEQDKAFVVDMKTGDDNEKTYAAINDMIIPNLWMILDYQACKKEVERIHKEIAQTKKFLIFPKH